jgi:N-methylhydantoinase B
LKGAEGQVDVAETVASQGEGLDAVQLAVITERFRGIVKQMVNSVFRMGQAGVINTAHDLSCCLITHDSQFLMMADSLPIHVMRGTDWQNAALKEFHPVLKRGEAYFHNSPYHGNTHAGDWGVMVPIVDNEGVHRFTAVAKAHLSDIGNSIAAAQHPWAKDVYEEGALIFPAVKVQENYRDIEDIIRMCLVRIRKPEQFYSDYLALLGGVRIAERRVLELGEELGWDTLERYTTQWFDYSEQMMAAAIRKMPAGKSAAYTAHDPFPGAPAGVPLQAIVEVKPDEGAIDVDATHNPDCLPNGLNLSKSTATTQMQIAIFNSVPADVPTNAGSFRRLNILLRENCCVGIPRHPHSCSLATTNLGNRIGSTTARALAELSDGIGHGEVGAIETPELGILSGSDPRKNGAFFINQVLLNCAGGAAMPDVDGWLTVGDLGAMGMVHTDSIESDEIQYPIYIFERNLLQDSEGFGRRRGAPGTYAEYGPIPGADMQVIYMTDGGVFPAPGARGGGHGSRAGQAKRTRDGQVEPQSPTGPVHLSPGETIIAFGPGGGGYGVPWERDEERVLRDVAEEWISRERAEKVYGVVITSEGEIDAKATAERRQALAVNTTAWKSRPVEILSEEEILKRCHQECDDIPYLRARHRWWAKSS